MKKGLIFDIKKYAIHDGPGIRTTIFFKGCPLSCWWCHNSEGQAASPELIFKENRCIEGCDECIKSCPKNALSRDEHTISLNRKICNLCGECAQICPSEALELIGKVMTIDEVMEEIEKERVFYDESNGGVTFSGGEPLMQPEFLYTLLDECKKRDIHTSIDTCGYAQFEVFEKIKDKVDLFLYDMKLMDDERHTKFTGLSNKPILDNLKKLAAHKCNIIVRIPIIPGINDDNDNINHIAQFLNSLPNIKEMSLLPYHKAGSEKYSRLDKPNPMKETQPPTEEKLLEIKETFEKYGFHVKIGG